MQIDIEVTPDGRIVTPPGMRLRIRAEAVPAEPSPQEVEERSRKLQALFDSINADADTIPLKPWPENDPVIEKYRRKGLID